MQITVRLFAGLRETVGRDTLLLDVAEASSIEQVWQTVRQQHSQIPTMTVMFAVNRQYADAATLLYAGDELAVIPPVSGG